MQINRLTISEYASVNNSEKYLRIFYRKSKSPRTNIMKMRMLKKFSVLTMEQIWFFEIIFELAYPGFLTRLKEQHPQLTISERTLLAFLKIELPYNHIYRNMGLSEEEIKRCLFSIYQKLQVSPKQLPDFIKGTAAMTLLAD